ncbi:amidohydrolase 2 [Trichodelitschia bisporula]|uniref:Amidohydrolase 2 n=1 Tax=Trichodelitschia bisporula TaxID=703511 RepID=A0A6G1HPN3_9PEZI|nr:amidohydrolase 2 [Trichodelitschia bisporula]
MPTVDIHTHIYPPAYISLLKARTTIPYIRTYPTSPTPRLVILPGEDSDSAAHGTPGRPIGPEYWDVNAKLAFMDAHNIGISVLSLANPWLDFLPADEAAAATLTVNDDIEAVCAAHPGRLFAFGALPLSAPAEQIVAEIQRLQTLPHMRGVIIGTTGLGSGLDDPALEPVWEALEATQTLVFLHPHYGLPSEVYGERGGEYGHVLPLALGFPLETTIAVARMVLSGVWDRWRGLKVLLAHSGGTLPFLAGRIESCIAHDGYLKSVGRGVEGRRSVWEILRENVYLDAVVYSPVGLKAAVDASGRDRVLFGTDHPFFPPLDDEEEWLSVKMNSDAIQKAFGEDKESADMVLGGNAIRILRLQEDADK